MRIRDSGFASHTYRNRKRYRKILAVLLKYSYDSLIERLHINRYVRVGMNYVKRQRPDFVAKLNKYERLRIALEELGPTFIKMGQILSTRPDLIPVELITELTKLQDNVPAFPFPWAKEILERELKAPIGEIFREFNETPFAAASIGQVHRARLKTGEEVIVKVQRPGIGNIIDVDIEILFHLAGLAEKYIEEFKYYRPTNIVNEFAQTLEKEINYNTEAVNTERFARQFLGNKLIYIPRIFREYTTERVLTMEYVEGIKASEIFRLDQQGYDRKIIAARGADLILEQIFKYGFFHADPHPGNVFILPGNIICYLDFGMMGRVSMKDRKDFADMIQGYVLHDEKKITDAVLRVVEWDREPDRPSLERDIAGYMELLYKPLKELRINDLSQGLLDIFSRHKMKMPPDIFLTIKALGEIEGLGLMLDPDFDMAKRAAPFIKNLKLESIQPKRLVSELLDAGEALLKFMKEFPEDLHDVIKQFKQGKANLVFEYRGPDGYSSEVQRSSNRIAFAIIIASLIVGSSLLITSQEETQLFQLSLFSLLGYAIAGILCIWLIISILRSGKL